MTEKAYYNKSFKKYIEKRDYDVSIYHYLPLKYLLRTLDTKELIVSQTMKWEDSYENFLNKVRFYFGGTLTSLGEPSPLVYGQCWTLKKETDAMWRIYSPNLQSVRIRTTIKKLLGVSLNEKDYEKHSTFIRIIGQVEYLTESKIVNWIKDRKTKRGYLNASDEVQSLFIKRKEFSHENEVRLVIHKQIYEDDFIKGNFKECIELVIEPNDIIEQITFDPRLDDKEFQTYKKIIRGLGYKNLIDKSRLYEFKPRIIE